MGLLLKKWWEDPNRVLGLFGNNWHRDSANYSERTNIGILNLKRYDSDTGVVELVSEITEKEKADYSTPPIHVVDRITLLLT